MSQSCFPLSNLQFYNLHITKTRPGLLINHVSTSCS